MDEPAERPARIAIVGAGPSGLFAAQALLKQNDLDVRVDVLDRLPTPFGLLRYGVAPVHTSIKAIAQRLSDVFADPRVRFFGLVDLGETVSRDELLAGYDAVVYAAGASEDRRLSVPGEELPGSVSAREFVAWYSGHPDARPHPLGDVRSAVTFGVGNVAVDVARMLLATPLELEGTDVPQPVLDELAGSPVTDVWVIGRRGPQHASFTTPELRELLSIDGVALDLDPAVLEGIDPAGLDRRVRANLDALAAGLEREVPQPRATLHLLFWRRPVRLLGTAAVESVVVEGTRPAGGTSVVGTGEETEIAAQLVLRAIGYRGKALPGVPFDEAFGVIPNVEGRVTDTAGAVQEREYVVGWIKRGPIGVIGTNKADAKETVAHLVADLAARTPSAQLVDVPALLAERGSAPSTYDDWLRIDAGEQSLGAERARARTKIESWHALRDLVRTGREGGPLEREEAGPGSAERPDAQADPSDQA
ncbi:NAD(P)-binding protein [Nigerium massiliense]|uniref:NAD(P)-binding protein n=1 Tax=Nigerium massiliense TaxID=1522317 RepID=UPI000907C854|nr:NAD(P)-binding protein [Nigerium massiliense]